MIMLQTQGLAKDFQLHLQGGIRIPVLRDVALTVRAGECVALAGPSGAGKSTLMRCLYGNYGVGSGVIWLRHQGAMLDIAAADARTMREVRRQTLGYVSQFLRVIPRVAALDVVAEPALASGLGRDAANERAKHLLAALNLPERLWHLPPATFSGGEQQRVNIARGFAGGHSVLILDEPTASLDATNREAVIGLIEARKATGAAFVGIFHDEEVRQRLADRIIDVSTFGTRQAA